MQSVYNKFGKDDVYVQVRWIVFDNDVYVHEHTDIKIIGYINREVRWIVFDNIDIEKINALKEKIENACKKEKDI